MGIFNHTITYRERWDDDLKENFVRLNIEYDNAFGDRKRIKIPFNDARNPSKEFSLDRVKITGTAITGSRIYPAMIVSVLSKHSIIATRDFKPQRYRWIDTTMPSPGDIIKLVESFHPISGEVSLVATSRQCENLGLMSMNVLILDETRNINKPILIEHINLLTGDIVSHAG